jgi:hypothetical protein
MLRGVSNTLTRAGDPAQNQDIRVGATGKKRTPPGRKIVVLVAGLA